MKHNDRNWPWQIAGTLVFLAVGALLLAGGWPWLESVIPASPPQTPEVEHPKAPEVVNVVPRLAELPWRRDATDPRPVAVVEATVPWRSDARSPRKVVVEQATLPWARGDRAEGHNGQAVQLQMAMTAWPRDPGRPVKVWVPTAAVPDWKGHP